MQRRLHSIDAVLPMSEQHEERLVDPVGGGGGRPGDAGVAPDPTDLSEFHQITMKFATAARTGGLTAIPFAADGTVTAAESQAWKDVAVQCRALLDGPGKSLLLPLTLTQALLRGGAGISAIAEGLELTCTLLEQHWHELYPLDIAERVGILDEFTELEFRNLDVSLDGDSVHSALRATDRIREVWNAQVPEGADRPERGVLATVRDELSGLVRTVDVGLDAVGAADGDPSSTPDGDDGDTSGDTEDELGFPGIDEKDALRTRLIAWATQRRRRYPTDPDAYALLRTAGLMGAETAEQMEALLRPESTPSAAVRQRLAGLADAGRYPALLDLSETALVRSPLWLDAHRYSVEALETLGNAYAPAHATALGALRSLLERFQELPERKFHSGAAVADATTYAWAREQTDRTPSPNGLDHASMRTLDGAMLLADAKDESGGLRLLLDGARTAWGGRDQLLWKLALVEFLQRVKRTHLAVSLMEDVEKADGGVPPDWEPRVAALIQATKLSLLREGGSDTKNDVKKILDKLAKLDLGRAFELDQGPE